MISVCIATYNGAAYIGEQLRSIACQLSADDEIVISDDGSTDGTLDVVKSLGLPQIHIVHHTTDHGYVSNFEHALKAATGDIIFLADQDDLWMPGKVERCLSLLEHCDFVVSDARVVNFDEEEIAPSFCRLYHSSRSYLGNIIRFRYLGCCMCFRRTILAKALPFPHNHKLCTHDNWLFLVAKTFYKAVIIDDKLIKYRRHEGNTSNGGAKSVNSTAFQLKYRLYLIGHLFRRAFWRKR